ncbi:hypothetical protein GCM10010285_62260 [Streptomyces pseudogriseolus]|uniref:Uncharacterized protein n=1 Tax=Streptomyces pseudogriseolus TaxID=36817 RepID=A0ABQ2TMT7_STREZ|nr:hypothetical protein GCM10010285_62260 [Streptomyces rubiginosus]
MAQYHVGERAVAASNDKIGAVNGGHCRNDGEHLAIDAHLSATSRKIVRLSPTHSIPPSPKLRQDRRRDGTAAAPYLLEVNSQPPQGSSYQLSRERHNWPPHTRDRAQADTCINVFTRTGRVRRLWDGLLHWMASALFSDAWSAIEVPNCVAVMHSTLTGLGGGEQAQRLRTSTPSRVWEPQGAISADHLWTGGATQDRPKA